MHQAPLASDLSDIDASLGTMAEAFAGQTVLLTGSCGFLGSYLVATFARLNRRLSQPVRVIAVDNFVTSSPTPHQPTSPTYRFLQHDVSTPLDPGEPVHLILHAAGIASPQHYRSHPLETIAVAADGTRHLLHLAQAQGARLLFLSSSEIYGDPPHAHVPTPEDYRGHVACQGPRACYDESKRLGETLCDVFHHLGVHTNTVRPFNVYGPGMREDDSRVLPNFASRIAGQAPLEVYGSGQQTRTFCYVTDAIDGILRVAASGQPGLAYNIGTPSPEVTIHDLVERTRQVLGQPVEAHLRDYPQAYPSDEPMRRCPDITRARAHLGFEPRVDLDEGLRRFYDWALQTYTGLRAAS